MCRVGVLFWQPRQSFGFAACVKFDDDFIRALLHPEQTEFECGSVVGFMGYGFGGYSLPPLPPFPSRLLCIHEFPTGGIEVSHVCKINTMRLFRERCHIFESPSPSLFLIGPCFTPNPHTRFEMNNGQTEVRTEWQTATQPSVPAHRYPIYPRVTPWRSVLSLAEQGTGLYQSTDS